MTAMEGWVDVIEEVPNMADDDAADFIFRYNTVDDNAESHQHPRQVRRGED